jgi:hypothetical protein
MTLFYSFLDRHIFSKTTNFYFYYLEGSVIQHAKFSSTCVTYSNLTSLSVMRDYMLYKSAYFLIVFSIEMQNGMVKTKQQVQRVVFKTLRGHFF